MKTFQDRSYREKRLRREKLLGVQYKKQDQNRQPTTLINIRLTPLEVITIIMGGEGNYVRNFETRNFHKNQNLKRPANTTGKQLRRRKGQF